MTIYPEEILENYKLITENANDLIRVVNNRFEIEYINETAHFQILGYHKDELIGKIGGIPIHQEEDSEARRFLYKVFKTGEAMRTGRIQHKNGNWIWVEIKGKTFKDKYEKQKAIIVSRDITERIVMEQNLKKESERAELYLNLAGVILVAINKDGIITLMNIKGYEVLEYEEGELIGKNWFETCLPSSVKDQEHEVFNQLIRGELEPVEYFENPVITENGKEKIIAWHNALLYDDNGNITGTLSSGEDITEKKRTENEFKRVNSELNQIFNIPLPLCVINKDYTIYKVNETYTTLIDKEKKEIIGEKCYNIWPGKFCHATDCPLTQILSGKDYIEYEKGLQKNKNITCLMRALPYKNHEGDVIGVIGAIDYFTDISDRIEAEQKLKESEEKFRIISEQSVIGISIIQDNKIKYVNQAMLDLFEYKREEIEQWPPGYFLNVLYPDFKEFIISITKKYQSTPSNKEIKVIKRNGDHFWINFFARSIIFNGKPAILNVNIDITERKRAVFALENEKNLYRDTINGLPGVFYLFNKHGKFEIWNENLELLSGYSSEEFKTLKPTDFFDESEKQKISDKIQEILTIGSGDVEVNFLTKNKFLTPYYWYGKKIMIDEEPYIVGLGFDVTEREIAKQLIIEENRKLTELNKMKRDIITRISHELKTPLTSVLGASYYLMNFHTATEKCREILEYLEIINRGGLRLKDLIDDLIDTSRLEVGKLELKKIEQNICEIIMECINELRYFAIARKIKMNIDLPERILIEIDKVRIAQVFSNIIINAIKNTPSYGEILVNLKDFIDHIVIRIKDTGVGVTQEEKPLIFKKFGKIERYGKGLDVDTEGSGLGLFISKEIVELHNGEIFFESEGRNKGTIFTVKLPKVSK